MFCVLIYKYVMYVTTYHFFCVFLLTCITISVLLNTYVFSVQYFFFFFFKQKTAYEMRISDWSSDVCSSDLALITSAMRGGGMVCVAWGWSQGRFSAGDVVFVSTLLSQLFRPLDLLGMVYRTIRQGVIDMAAMFDLIDTPSEVIDTPDAPALAVTNGHVRFEDVRFGYDDGRAILKGITIDIPAGHTVAVVGPSGAGKSTLARLMYRFYDLPGGRITIDGKEIGRAHV